MSVDLEHWDVKKKTNKQKKNILWRNPLSSLSNIKNLILWHIVESSQSD